MPRVGRIIEDTPDAVGLRVAIVVSRYHSAVTDALLEGACAEFLRLGGEPEALVVVRAPGAFELPVLAAAAAEEFDAVVTLGCVVAGETRHDHVIADAVAGGLTRVAVESSVPIGFGVLTVSSLEQAKARAQPVSSAGEQRGDEKRAVGNKGVEAMNAAISAASAIRRLRGLECRGNR